MYVVKKHPASTNNLECKFYQAHRSRSPASEDKIKKRIDVLVSKVSSFLGVRIDKISPESIEGLSSSLFKSDIIEKDLREFLVKVGDRVLDREEAIRLFSLWLEGDGKYRFFLK